MIITLVNNLPIFTINFKQKHLSLIEEDIDNKKIIIGQSYLEYSAASESSDIVVNQSFLDRVVITNV